MLWNSGWANNYEKNAAALSLEQATREFSCAGKSQKW
jgi:hypothetical protein